jgi:uncharacterized iron-regulated membrane protein
VIIARSVSEPRVTRHLMRRVLFQLHLWTGLIAGLYLAVIGITGAALVFRLDLQRALHPTLFTASGDGPLAEPATVLERVRRAYPRDRVSGIEAPTTTRPTYLAYVISGNRFVTLLVDPVSARVLGELPERSVIRTLQDLHFDLLSGRRGRIVNGIGAGGLLLLCLTGAVIWWPGVSRVAGALIVHRRRGWKRLNRELHGAVGVWAVPVIAMWAVTGIAFAFPSGFRAAVNALSPITISRAPQSGAAAAGQPPAAWSMLIEAARRRVPGHHVARVVLPPDEHGAFVVMFSSVSPTPAGGASLMPVYLDQFTGAVLREPGPAARTAGDLVMAWVAPLHIGNFGGTLVKAIWAVLGVAPALLFATALMMWWTRVLR